MKPLREEYRDCFRLSNGLAFELAAQQVPTHLGTGRHNLAARDIEAARNKPPRVNALPLQVVVDAGSQ
jgi:hypothetical protein